MTSFTVGRRAESIAADYLRSHGFTVLDKNWRTRYCEVDLVVRKQQTIYFVEVKYRAHDSQGGGLDYITSTKLKQMSFAARLWVQQHRWGGEYQLAALAVSGPDFMVSAFVSIDE